VLDVFRRSRLAGTIAENAAPMLKRVTRARLALPERARLSTSWSPSVRLVHVVWLFIFGAIAVWLGRRLIQLIGPVLSWEDFLTAAGYGGLTFLRVTILIALASAVWVPLGVWIGLRPKLTERVQPVAQFLAAFPANLLYPVAVVLIVRFQLAPAIWLSPLMILGTQWYILFNVIAGASAFPSDLREAAQSLRIGRLRWWRQVMLPGILPYYITGAITASGGAWNASIVSEAVNWGSTRLSAPGLGAYIATMTEAGDYPRIALGIAVMSILVVSTNRLIWRPLYAFAERRTRLN
jgi:NitT/TauT family transport system permease protein